MRRPWPLLLVPSEIFFKILGGDVAETFIFFFFETFFYISNHYDMIQSFFLLKKYLQYSHTKHP